MDPGIDYVSEPDADDDESVPPHFNEPEFGIGMEGESDDDED